MPTPPPTDASTPGTTAWVDAGLAIITALDLTPIDGWSAEDLAEIIGCSPTAIHRRTAAALNTLKTKLPADLRPE